MKFKNYSFLFVFVLFFTLLSCSGPQSEEDEMLAQDKFDKKAPAENLIKSLERIYFDLREKHSNQDEHWLLANTWLKRYASPEQAKQISPEQMKFISYNETLLFSILEQPKSIRMLALYLIYEELGESLAIYYASEYNQIMEPVMKIIENHVFLDKYKERNPRTWKEMQEEDDPSLNMLLIGLEYQQEHPEEAEKLEKILWKEIEKRK